MYRALGSIAPEKCAGGLVERQQSSVFTAEINLAVLHDRLPTKLKRIRYRPHHAAGSLIKRISSAIKTTRKYFSMTERECAAQWSNQRRHPLCHTAFTTECTQRARRFLSLGLNHCF